MLNKRLWWAGAFSQWIHVAWKVFVSQHVTPLRYNFFFLMVKSFTALVFIDLKRMECDNHCVAQFQSKDVLQWHREEVLGRWVVHYINLCSRNIGEHPGSRLGETPTEDWTVHRYDAINTFTPAVIVNNNSCIPVVHSPHFTKLYISYFTCFLLWFCHSRKISQFCISVGCFLNLL